MCGRYVRRSDKQRIAEHFHVYGPSVPDFGPSWNVAPQTFQPVVRLNRDTREREIVMMRWGLIPFWAKDPKIAYKTINARVETVDTAPSYREAFKKRRCLIPADSFYEWKKVPGGKIPFSIGMKDDAPFVFAGLWEGWKDPTTDEWLRTCTIITGEPNEFVREIHTRMPVILPEEHHDAWLSGGAGKEILVPFPANRMKAWPIDARVNSPENNDPEIIVPIEQHEKISQVDNGEFSFD